MTTCIDELLDAAIAATPMLAAAGSKSMKARVPAGFGTDAGPCVSLRLSALGDTVPEDKWGSPMSDNAVALEYLRAAMYEEVDAGRTERTIAAGRDTFRLSIESESWSDLATTSYFTMIADIVLNGRSQRLEFSSRDFRDMIGLHMHLSYMAAYRNTVMQWDVIRAEQKGFVSDGERVVLPFLKEDERSWIGVDLGERVVLTDPAAHYGDKYVSWRDEVCALFDHIVLPMQAEPPALRG
jgi:hypothetical protein